MNQDQQMAQLGLQLLQKTPFVGADLEALVAYRNWLTAKAQTETTRAVPANGVTSDDDMRVPV